MIINESTYNPLGELFKYNLLIRSTDMLNIVQHELFKAGVVPESAEEFEQVLKLLQELEREFYGKK